MKHVSEGWPATATTSPARTATAWTRCAASTTPLRRTWTRIGSLTQANHTCLANGRLLQYGRDVPTIDGYDYAAEDTMLVSEPAQLRAMADPFRVRLVQLLRDRARSTQEISEELEVPKGTVGHHLKVLESAGLIRVVRTRKVRAVTEKFYGRTARLFLYQTEDPADGRAISAVTLRQAASEVDLAQLVAGFGLVRARLTERDIDRFGRRARKLMDDFRAADCADGIPSSLTAGLWAMEADDA